MSASMAPGSVNRGDFYEQEGGGSHDATSTSTSILTAVTQYNDKLSQRQAEVRAALNDLYGGGEDEGYDNGRGSNGGSDTRSSNKAPQLKLAFDLGMSIEDGESLSFDPITTTHGTTGPQHGTVPLPYNPIVHENDGDTSEGDSLSSFSLSLLCDLNSDPSINGDVAHTNAGSIMHPPHESIDMNGIETQDESFSSRHQTPHYSQYIPNDSTGEDTDRVKHASGHNSVVIQKRNKSSHDISNANNGNEDITAISQNKEVVDLQTQIKQLHNIKSDLQDKITILQADQVLLSKTPTKFQVELDSMRLVADQVQIEAEERVKAAEIERDNLKNRLEEILQNGNDGNGGKERNDESSDSGMTGKQNEYAFEMMLHAILEQLCLLEESGLRKDVSYPMDHIVKDAMKKSSINIPDTEGKIQMYLDRLARGCGGTNVSASVISEGHPSNVTVSTSPERNNVSMSIDAENLLPKMRNKKMNSNSSPSDQSHLYSQSPTALFQQKMSDLQLENASLKGSNEHLKEQLDRYKQQTRTLKASLSTNRTRHNNGLYASSPSFSTSSSNSHENYKDLKQANLQLSQQLQVVYEGKRAAEEENAKVVNRCIELEQVAEEATRECERLVQNSTHKEEIECIQKERDELLTAQIDYEEATMRREEEHDNFRKEMKNELETLQVKCDNLVESSGVLEKEVESLRKTKTILESEVEGAKSSAVDQQEQLTSLESKMVQTEEEKSLDGDEIAQLKQNLQSLTVQRDDLLEQTKEFQNFQKNSVTSSDLDECSRLRNLNAMIKAKIELIEEDLDKARKESIAFAEEVASLRKESDFTRAENVSLSDANTDMQTQLIKLEEQCTSHKNVISRLENEVAAITSARDDLKKKNAVLSDQCASQEKSLTSTNEKNTNLLKEMKDTEFRVQELEVQIHNLNAHMEQSETNIKQHDKRVVFDEKIEEEINPVNPSEKKLSLLVQDYVPHRGVVGVQTPETIITHGGNGFNTSSVPPRSDAPPRTDASLSTVRSSLFNSMHKSALLHGKGSTQARIGSMRSMDDQLERIKHAKERAIYTFKTVSNYQSTGTGVSPKQHISNELSQKPLPYSTNASKIDETEAFVNDILQSCGRQKLAA